MPPYTYSVLERFLRYVQIDTQSDSGSDTFPSTKKQLHILNLLVEELKRMGMDDVAIDEFGYVTATLATNTKKDIPCIAFLAHVDTATEVTGANVKPIVHEKYDGKDIKLPDDSTQILKFNENPYLRNLIGHDIVTASGKTLLGADDKSGVAIIMDAMQYLVQHPEIKHGKVRILFSPDEEVGHGMDHLNTKKLGAKYAYTLDASEKGEIEFENFSADGLTITFYGKAIHPGYAKDKMINAIKIASYFISLLPNEYAPEHTEKYEGFVHPISIKAGNEEAIVEFIVRDFETRKLHEHEDMIHALAEKTMTKFIGARYEITIKEQYRNMREIIEKHMQVVDYAKEAMTRLGIEPITKPIRGGTDGASLTYMGIPCPNLFTGQQNYHGKREYISARDMLDSVRTVVEVCKVWEEKTK